MSLGLVYSKKKVKRNSSRFPLLGLFSQTSKKKKNLNTKISRTHQKSENKFALHEIFDFRLNHDKPLLYVFLSILAIGVIAIFSATIPFAYYYSENNNKYFYLQNHLRLIALGFVVFSIFYFLKVEFIMRFWKLAYVFCILMLGYLLYLSFTEQIEAIDGATRWLSLGSLQFQPSEFVKLGFIIFLAPFLTRLSEKFVDKETNFENNIKLFSVFIMLFFIIIGMILLTRNLGTALVIGFIGLLTFWASAKTRFQNIGFLILMVLIILGGIVFTLTESYRMDRIQVWINYLKTNDTLYTDENGVQTREGKSYQLDQVLTSIGSGGITGLGIGRSVGKYYLPKTSAGDDSIFGVMAEELGFIITTGILLLYFYLIQRLLNTANLLSNNMIYYLTLISIAAWIGFQTFVHVGANLGILPMTGQTLPFISLGGSSIISLMGAMGLALNISKNRLESTKKENEVREITYGL